jgi:hypothetical protein
LDYLDPLKMRFHAGMMGNLVEHNATQCGDKLGQRSVRKFDEKMLGEGWHSKNKINPSIIIQLELESTNRFLSSS